MSLALPAPIADDGRALPERSVTQAIDWYVQHNTGTLSAAQRHDFEAWLSHHPDHPLAWQRLQGIGQRLQHSRNHVAPEVTRATLAQAPRRVSRRLLLGLGLGFGSLVYLGREPLRWQTPVGPLLADASTATGEQRRLTLPDGTRVLLDTDTAIDLRDGSDPRQLLLRRGTIQVTTGPGARPWTVVTTEGSLTPLGTRFEVQRLSGQALTFLQVAEGVVAIQPREGSVVRVPAGQQASFSRTHTSALTPLTEPDSAWTHGRLAATQQPLGEFIATLARYHPGWLRCDPAIAHLPVTGTWPIGTPEAVERILAALARHLPVQVQRRSRYWITVVARPADQPAT